MELHVDVFMALKFPSLLGVYILQRVYYNRFKSQTIQGMCMTMGMQKL